MFGKEKKGVHAILGKGVVCEGDFTAQGSSRIDGIVNGNVDVQGELVIGPCGIVKGNVTTETAIIGGRVEGYVKASERIELTPSASLGGDIACRILVVDEGAYFNGRVVMDQAEREAFPAQDKAAAQEQEKTSIAVQEQENNTASGTKTDAPEQAEAADPEQKTDTPEEQKKDGQKSKERKSAKSAFMKAMHEMEEAKKKQKNDNSEEN